MYFNVEIIITDPVYIVKSVNDGTDQELFFSGQKQYKLWNGLVG